jgi:uncharacterized protein
LYLDDSGYNISSFFFINKNVIFLLGDFMKNSLSAIIIGLAIVLSALFISNAYKNKYHADDSITVTGLGKKDFVSDLIVWNANFSRNEKDMKTAYDGLKKDKDIVANFLISKGVKPEEMVFSSINIDREYDNISDKNGIRQKVFKGYKLTQSIDIQSNDVDRIERISREVTELINIGVELYSSFPRFYYTKLADLKVEMIAAATKDARIRAERIAENSKAELGKLKNASMGIFQITGQNSDEDFTAGGTMNTSSKKKTATITMRLQFSSK